MTRCKFVIREMAHSQYNGKPLRTLRAGPVYSTKEGTENKLFWDYTPTGSFELGTVNAAAVEGLEPGDEIYIDITKAPKEQA